MKRAIIPALLVALLFAVPAGSQDDAATLREEVDALKAKVEEQDRRIWTLHAYVDATKKEAKSLAKALESADKGGFTFPAPNADAKATLLKGLQAFAKTASTGLVATKDEAGK
ncbi:MAG: hypothetical protein ACREID_09235 [Planctomycetota bacterium]